MILFPVLKTKTGMFIHCVIHLHRCLTANVQWIVLLLQTGRLNEELSIITGDIPQAVSKQANRLYRI